ncbi:MAG TPA: hypothetical protein VFT98_14340 [Myxococcota bacterium]|nr:hypothetical protein [Myxococcota bacterium]
MSAASAVLRVFALLLALLALLAHALRARFLLGADRGSERLAQWVRAAADGLLRVIARVDALSERWDAVGAPAWDQLARDVREIGERALRHARAEAARADLAARAIGSRSRELGARAAMNARTAMLDAARRARLAGQRAWAAARPICTDAVARARAFPLQLAARVARLPSPRVPLSQHQVLIAASFVAVLALHIGGARDDSAVAAPAPLKPPAVVAALPEPPAAAAAPPIRVRVNARPWAFIRVDGVAVGPTPLSHLHLAEGPHEFEAEFADGRRLKQEIVIGPEKRWVSLR